ncbi:MULTISPECIES: protein adenylyltransferase SelO [unclassified Clostridium]|uniref:protein adenylyltransferase SelO n=1 Tax=unclassified Clostridium TaxID=2614128 RepID=UPI001C8CAC8E|nr:MULTISPECIES: YdiU family protein [unclassified Clostridium]MBX9138069.1 YdiU family protein [Clostridium sp. K12(2020)]MBX9142810.1 YdiU family protein [Clostridium sp. K13]MDU2290317.1 YdiU family protein [Clostridium celatum]MDU4324255.1 YdiU family protein [Clostridium celatum]
MKENNINFNLENTYCNLSNIFYSRELPSKIENPTVIKFNKELAEILGLDLEFLESNKGIEFLVGNNILEGITPIAQAYAGHQFGHFTMLGDGRAILLGEFISKDGQKFDIQIKGAGRTRYSRGGDGKAALGPMLREYIISEGMYGLKIPTTRSLAVISTGEDIIREEILEGAVLDRIAKSHIRVGTFQFARNFGSVEELRELADYTLNRHFKKDKYEENPYLYLLKEVIKNQAKLISKWQLVGFIHGVMNTDNMTISGETIDYGPCAFMDTYDINTVFSSIDVNGRYSYGNQPKIGVWNLTRFAESLLPLLDDDVDKAIKIAEDALASYSVLYNEYYFDGMRAKLGLFDKEEGDEKLVLSLLTIMNNFKADYTNTFLNLTLDKLDEMKVFNSDEFKEWYNLWQKRITKQNVSREKIKGLMESNNPTVIPRNYIVEKGIKAAVNNNDYSIINRLLEVLKNPYDYSNISEEFSKIPEVSSCPYKTYCGT